MADRQSTWSGTGTLLLASLALIWAGMIIGVSGLATPVKFTAPTLTLPVALDVGRVTFRLFGRVEWGLAFILLLLGVAARVRLLWLPIGLVVAVVLAQAVWLLPALDVRTASVISGAPPPANSLHAWYIAAEAVKLVALLAAGIGVIRSG
jgi:hypothetical protein